MPLRLGPEVQALLRGNLTPRQRRLPSALTELLGHGPTRINTPVAARL